jgi:hypothetical protein
MSTNEMRRGTEDLLATQYNRFFDQMFDVLFNLMATCGWRQEAFEKEKAQSSSAE